MKKSKILLFSLIVISLFIGVNKFNSNQNIKSEAYLNINNFTEGMALSDLKNELGEPLKDIGSGVHILMYKYSNNEIVSFEFDSNNKLVSAQIIENKF